MKFKGLWFANRFNGLWHSYECVHETESEFTLIEMNMFPDSSPLNKKFTPSQTEFVLKKENCECGKFKYHFMYEADFSEKGIVGGQCVSMIDKMAISGHQVRNQIAKG